MKLNVTHLRYDLNLFFLFSSLPGLQPARGLCVALWIDNGNTFFRAGWEFSLSPFHPPDEVRVKAEAGNGCATWEIIQLSDQRGHTRGLITSSSTAGQPVRRPGACVSQLATLTYLNVVRVVHQMLLLSGNISETKHSVQHYETLDICAISNSSFLCIIATKINPLSMI